MQNKWTKWHTPLSSPIQNMISGIANNCPHGALLPGGSRVDCQDLGLKFGLLMWLLCVAGLHLLWRQNRANNHCAKNSPVEQGVRVICRVPGRLFSFQWGTCIKTEYINPKSGQKMKREDQAKLIWDSGKSSTSSALLKLQSQVRIEEVKDFRLWRT